MPAMLCATISKDIAGKARSYRGGNTLPGLRMPSGSSACLMARIADSVAGLKASAMKSRFAKPIPCSPDNVPPRDNVRAKTRGNAECARVLSSASCGS